MHTATIFKACEQPAEKKQKIRNTKSVKDVIVQFELTSQNHPKINIVPSQQSKRVAEPADRSVKCTGTRNIKLKRKWNEFENSLFNDQIIKFFFPDPKERKEQVDETVKNFDDAIETETMKIHNNNRQAMLDIGLSESKQQKILDKTKAEARVQMFSELKQRLVRKIKRRLNKNSNAHDSANSNINRRIP